MLFINFYQLNIFKLVTDFKSIVLHILSQKKNYTCYLTTAFNTNLDSQNLKNVLQKKKHIGTLAFFPQIFGITSECPEPIATVHYVNSCPQSAEKWAEAAERLNCHSISTKCTTFVYHCVMDPYQTRLIEVCAPKKLILGNKGFFYFLFKNTCFVENVYFK